MNKELTDLKAELSSTKAQLKSQATSHDLISYKQTVLRDDTSRIDERSIANKLDLVKLAGTAAQHSAILEDLRQQVSSIQESLERPNFRATVLNILDCFCIGHINRSFTGMVTIARQSRDSIRDLEQNVQELTNVSNATAHNLDILEEQVEAIEHRCDSNFPTKDHPGNPCAVRRPKIKIEPTDDV